MSGKRGPEGNARIINLLPINNTCPLQKAAKAQIGLIHRHKYDDLFMHLRGRFY